MPGDGDFSKNQDHQSPEIKKEIPLSWFAGVAKSNGNIMLVLFSSEFNNLGGTEFKDSVLAYSHFMGVMNIDGKMCEDISEIPNPDTRENRPIGTVF